MGKRTLRAAVINGMLVCGLVLSGCSDDVEALPDGALEDGGADLNDAGVAEDGPALDHEPQDASATDGPVADGPVSDGPVSDGPLSDGPLPDGSPPDGGPSDTSGFDVVLADGGVPLAGCPFGCGDQEVCLAGSCTAVGPAKSCGTDTYGTGLPATGVIYVDGSFTGTSTGSQNQPFSTIADAIAAAIPTTKAIAVAAGTYEEDLAIDKSVSLHCRCPIGADKVTIAGTVTIVPQVGNADVDVTIDGCRIAPAGFSDQPIQWGSCLANGDPVGIYAHSINHAISLMVVDSEIAGWCTGIYFNVAWYLPKTSICVSRTRLLANVKGLDVVEAPTGVATQWNDACKGIQEPVAVELSQVDQNKDHGVHTRTGAQGISLKGNLIELTGTIAGSAGGLGFGIYLGNTETAQILDNRIVNNLNRGLAMANLSSLVANGIVIDGNTVANNVGAGIQLQDLQTATTVQITNNLVTDTQALVGTPGGDGIQVIKIVGMTYNVDVVDNIVEDSQRNGVILDGVGGAVDGNTIINSGNFGVVLQQSTATVGSNTYAGNSAGDQVSYSNPVELCGALPIPIP